MPTPTDDESDTRELIQIGYRYALSLTHDQHNAEELVQQACLKILARRSTLVGKAYLLTTVRNLFYDGLRKAAHSATIALDDELIDRSRGHAEQVDDKLQLDAMLGSLRVEEREALYLNYVEGYTAEEISKLTNRPRGTVLSLIARARQRLSRHHDRDNQVNVQ